MNTFVAVYALSTITALLLLYISIYKSKKIKLFFFTFFILHVSIYMLGVTIEISSETIRQATIANTIEFLGTCFIPQYFLLTICEYTENEIKNKWLLASLFVIPVCTFLLVLTYPLNHIFYTEYTLVNIAGINFLGYTGSIYRTIFFIHFVFLILISFYLMLSTYLKSGSSTKKRMAFLLKGTIIPFIVAIAYLLGTTPYGIDFTPLSLLLMCLYYMYHLLFKEVFITKRFARSYILDNMKDGYFLVDEQNRFIDANKNAKIIFPSLLSCNIGESINPLPDLPKPVVDNALENKIIEHTIDDRHYHLQKSVLKGEKKNIFNCWIIYDVTKEILVKQELNFMATHDSLTKIYNRNTFYQLSAHLFLENVDNRHSFAIVMMDIDFFKKINDLYGHPNGDKVIIRLTENVQSCIRDTDIFARYGGEEFILFLNDVEKENAYNIAEKLRNIIQKDVITLNDVEVNITISIGVSVYDKDLNFTLEQYIDKADKLLYSAKQSGRNKVMID